MFNQIDTASGPRYIFIRITNFVLEWDMQKLCPHTRPYIKISWDPGARHINYVKYGMLYACIINEQWIRKSIQYINSYQLHEMMDINLINIECEKEQNQNNLGGNHFSYLSQKRKSGLLAEDNTRMGVSNLLCAPNAS